MNIQSRKLKFAIGIFLLISSSIAIASIYQGPRTQVIVNFESFDDVSITALESLGVKIDRQFSIIPSVVVDLPVSMISAVENLPGVSSVQENQRYTVSVVPNDPDYGQLWGMDKISAPAAWDVRTDASSVIVAVIDTGVQITHPDLAANIWSNPGEIAGNGIDDDGNGYVDDVNGWDFANNDNSVYDSTCDDHGTHVSGTIGGVGNNGVGVAGVSWKVKIMPLKFLTSTGGSTANAITAIEYATNMGANIISASWGGGGYDAALKSAIEAFPGLFIAAAGNDASDNDATASYPASYNSPNIVSVASTTSTDGLSSFSNWGATTVDLGAPGSNIYSTWPSNTYNTISGTSMATPHVSGAAALILANDPTLTPAQLKAKLMDFADPIPALNGKTVSGGRLNVYASLTGTAPPPPPPPPPTVTETFTGSVSSGTPNQIHYFNVDAAGDISATLNWGTSADLDMYLYAPGADPNSATGYLVRAYTTSNPETMTYSATATGQYAIRVNLYSGVTSSYTLDVTHPGSTAGDTTAPSQVTGLTANAVSTSQIDLSWNAATDDVGVTGYNIYRDGTLLTTSTATSYSDTGLSASTTYSYQVSAFDAAGNEGALSTAASATTQTPADTTAPSITIVSPTGTVSGTITVDATITDNVGVTSADYNIDGGSWVALSNSAGDSWTASLDTTTMADGTYTINFRAFDAAGNQGTASGSFTVSNTQTGPITETFTGSVSSSSPNQIFYFDVGSAGDISATLSWAGSTDLDMYLYAPGVDPNGNGYVVRAYTLNNPETLSYAATQTGTWAIRVNFYSGSAVSFTLDVTHPPGTSAPPPSTVTDTFTGSVSSSSPNQIFYFDLGSSGDISATLSWAGSTDLDMYLYAPGADPNGNSYVARAYTLNNPETITYAATQTGTWAIRVNFYSGSAVSFTLDVTHPAPAALNAFSLDNYQVPNTQNLVNVDALLLQTII